MRQPDHKPSVYLGLCRQMARLSRDGNTQVGAVIIGSDGRMCGIGYNGPPPQVDDAKVLWNERHDDLPSKYTALIHADEAAILDSLRKGHARDLPTATMYVTGKPCSHCMLRIINAGIRRVVYDPGVKPRCVGLIDQKKTAHLLSILKPGCEVTVEPYEEPA